MLYSSVALVYKSSDTKVSLTVLSFVHPVNSPSTLNFETGLCFDLRCCGFIVDFGVGGLGTIEINGESYPNSLYLKGGYNASEQGKGYGSMGLKFIFDKLPKINNIILQCFDTACPFWEKMGGQEIAVKEMPGGHPLRTLRISRDSFE